jgi:hypothetical protein
MDKLIIQIDALIKKYIKTYKNFTIPCLLPNGELSLSESNNEGSLPPFKIYSNQGLI